MKEQWFHETMTRILQSVDLAFFYKNVPHLFQPVALQRLIKHHVHLFIVYNPWFNTFSIDILHEVNSCYYGCMHMR